MVVRWPHFLQLLWAGTHGSHSFPCSHSVHRHLDVADVCKFIWIIWNLAGICTKDFSLICHWHIEVWKYVNSNELFIQDLGMKCHDDMDCLWADFQRKGGWRMSLGVEWWYQEMRVREKVQSVRERKLENIWPLGDVSDVDYSATLISNCGWKKYLYHCKKYSSQQLIRSQVQLPRLS